MAINTGGYDLSRFTALPTAPLTQSDPQAVNNGILSQFNVASESDKLQALNMLLSENQALHEDRIAAGHADLQNKIAQNLASIQLRPQQTANTAYGDQTIGLNQPGQRALTLGNTAFQVEQQPTLQNTQAITNSVANTTAQNDQGILPDKLAVTANKAYVDARQSDQNVDNLDTTLALSQQKLENEYATAQDAYANSQRTLDDASRLSQATAAYHEGQTALDKAKATYYSNGGSSSKRAAVDPQLMALRQERASMTELKDTLAQPVGTMSDGSLMKLGTYEALSRNNDGSIKDGYKPGQENYNEKAEALIIDAKYHRDAIQRLHQPPPPPPLTVGLPGSTGASGPGSVQAQGIPVIQVPGAQTDSEQGAKEVDVSALSPDQQEAYSWALEHQDDPRSPAIWASLPSK